jgi:hypothetical protein
MRTVADTDQTRVVFRVWPDHNGGDVIALFPDVPYDNHTPGRVESYQHIGQHGAADYNHVIAATRPATPDEYAPLLAELQQIGYNVQGASMTRYEVLEAFARETIGDGKRPNLYFVTDRGHVVTVTTDLAIARSHWDKLAARRPLQECALEDRVTGVIADVSPDSDEPNAPLRVWR